MKDKIKCCICNKECNGITGLNSHIMYHHKEYFDNHCQKYYDEFIDSGDHKCPICGKQRKFKGLAFGYFSTCSVEHANKYRGIKVKQSGCRIGFGKGRKGRVPSEEERKNLSQKMKEFYNTKNGKRLKKLSSERQKGEKNTCHKMSKETIERSNNQKSQTMKQKILNGEFTPNITNSWCRSKVKIKINGFKKWYRSSWDAAVQILNPSFQYEKIRIPYINERGETHIYIVDFVDEVNKILYEVKPDRCQQIERNVLKTKYAVQWCEENGYQYKIISNNYFKENASKIQYNLYDKKIYKGMKQFL